MNQANALPDTYPSLEALRQLVVGLSWEQALPSHMNEGWLHGVATDLRELDAAEPNTQLLARPTQLFGAISYARLKAMGKTSRDVKSFDVNRGLVAYQYLVEREIVNRAPGLPKVDPEAGFIAYLDQVISEGLGA